MSEQRLQNKVTVITGGNSGIGLAAAKEFRAQGASVVIAGRDEKTLADAARELGGDTLAVRLDVSRLGDLDNLYARVKERFGKIDVLFVNAGVGEFAPITAIDEALFDRTVDINFKGAYFSVTKALPLMGKDGSIILTSSTLNDKGMPGTSVYSATKAAVRSLARSFAAELVERGIRVNVLSPGPVETPIFGRHSSESEAKAFKASIAEMNPMRRMGRPEEMARVALFLASSDSSYMTGADIKADGGSGQI